jgi:hypothetical protein
MSVTDRPPFASPDVNSKRSHDAEEARRGGRGAGVQGGGGEGRHSRCICGNQEDLILGSHVCRLFGHFKCGRCRCVKFP